MKALRVFVLPSLLMTTFITFLMSFFCELWIRFSAIAKGFTRRSAPSLVSTSNTPSTRDFRLLVIRRR